MKNNKSLILQVLILAAGIGLAYYVGSLRAEVKYLQKNIAQVDTTNQPKAPTNTVVKNLQPPTEDDHTRGSNNPKFALIEYSDYECPYCMMFHETAKSLAEDQSNELVWIYRQFPLPSHPQGKPRALASECVYLQAGNDGFWKFTDAIFSSDKEITDLDSFVADLGFDMTAYKKCMDGNESEYLVNEDLKSAQEVGVNGTPGNFIMNLETKEAIPLYGAVPATTIKQAIESLK